MKVNMALVSEEDEEPMEVRAEAEAEEEDDEYDESDKHSKLKTFLLVVAMVGGFGLFVWNMTGLVNNMRLDNQGFAVNTVYDMEELGDFMENMGEGSQASDTPASDKTESGVSTDAARDGPGAAESGNAAQVADRDGSSDTAALRKEVQDALNEAALVKQELKNAEDMLDSSLQREAQLQSQLDALTKGGGQ